MSESITVVGLDSVVPETAAVFLQTLSAAGMVSAESEGLSSARLLKETAQAIAQRPVKEFGHLAVDAVQLAVESVSADTVALLNDESQHSELYALTSAPDFLTQITLNRLHTVHGVAFAGFRASSFSYEPGKGYTGEYQILDKIPAIKSFMSAHEETLRLFYGSAADAKRLKKLFTKTVIIGESDTSGSMG